MKCRKCGSEKMGVMPNKKNPAATDLYCLECGAWQKFATRDEIRLYQTRKSVITNAERFRAQSDEDLAKELAMIAEWDRKELAKAKRGPGLVKFMENWLQAPAGEDTYHA